MIPKFSIYYNNGDVAHGGGEDDEEVTLTFSRKWLEAPSDGVSHIVVECPELGRAIRTAYEYYFQLPLNSHGEGDVGGSMKIGPYLRQLTNTVGSLVKFGGWTSSRQYKRNSKRASQDTYVPKMSSQFREQQEDTAD